MVVVELIKSKSGHYSVLLSNRKMGHLGTEDFPGVEGEKAGLS